MNTERKIDPEDIFCFVNRSIVSTLEGMLITSDPSVKLNLDHDKQLRSLGRSNLVAIVKLLEKKKQVVSYINRSSNNTLLTFDILHNEMIAHLKREMTLAQIKDTLLELKPYINL